MTIINGFKEGNIVTDNTPEEDMAALATRLKQYNRWRRGADTKHPDPTTLGKDIDAAISILKELAGQQKGGNL